MAWGELADRQDLLRLAAVAAQGLGAKGLKNYRPPSAELAAHLAAQAEEHAQALRRAQVLAVVLAAGGEAG